MATKTNPGVWGVDIGQCALKAMRCEIQDGEVVATQVDYIEYPKILSQPDADPEALIADALEQLKERNDINDERVAVSVSGQAGLAKFFKPPPIEQKKLRDIVEFEARQQIPFELSEVVWDYQQMGGGTELEGLITEAEIGLFAMKRDQVVREMRPFDNADLKLDAIQLAPMAIYNCITYDLLDNCPDPDAFDPDSPPASYMVLSIGTETTDMIITNGFRVWHRSIPIGGNHFTRQMTQQLKLTFAKAEHLKRNAREAPDPKRVFQAMRSVYDSLGTEVQRSLKFFEGIDRKATINGLVILGNTAKLPGLRSFVGKKLELELVDLETWNRLKGSSVTASPTFRNNVLAYGNCYGLCLQTLGLAQLQTNLLPRELLFDRLVDSKKPWVVAAVSLLLVAFTFNYFLNYTHWNRVAHDSSGATMDGHWEAELANAKSASSKSTKNKQDYEKIQKEYDDLLNFGKQMIGNGDRQVMWLELIGSINSVLPGEQTQWRDPDVVDFKDRPDIYIESVDNAYFTEEDLEAWWEKNSPIYTADKEETDQDRQTWLDSIANNPSFIQNNQAYVEFLRDYEADRIAKAAAEAADNNGGGGGSSGGSGDSGSDDFTPPEDGAWVVQLKGYHYFNNNNETGFKSHVQYALLERLRHSVLTMPTPFGVTPFSMEQMGIKYVVLVNAKNEGEVKIGASGNNNGFGGAAGGFGGDPAGGTGAGTDPASGFGGNTTEGGNDGNAGGNAAEEEKEYIANKYSFTVQFMWEPNEVSERYRLKAEADDAARLEREKQAEEAARLNGDQNGSPDSPPIDGPDGPPAGI